MIAAIEWIPAGRANPAPSKYEYSRAEQEFLEKVQAGELGEEEANDEEWEDVDDNASEEQQQEEVEVPAVDPESLPADLRMDDYSDDEDGEDKVGGLLVGKDAEMMIDAAEAADDDDDDDIDSDDDDSEDEDDLADVPDTREFTPLDLEGLHAMGIGGSSGKGVGGDNEGYTLEDLQNMTMNNDDLNDEEDDEEEDEDDIDDIKIRDQDALILVAKAEEDFASLEINVFDTEYNNLYVHHDIPLPSFPLCLALGSVVGSYQSNENNGISAGNYVAIGSFEPGIEIWNLDVMNALEPTLVLGGMDTRGSEEEWMRMQMPVSTSANGGGKKKKKNKKKDTAGGLREGSHTDAVMSLSWNTVHQQVLASGSADGTVKLWDCTHSTSGKKGDYIRPSATLTHHTDKVQSLAWHPSEGTLLATGGYDRRVCLADARSTDSQSVKTAKLLADCEAIAWDPHNQQYLTVASEDGVVQCWDVRKFGGDPVWSMIAHEYGGVSDISYNAHVPGMLLTCSIDKTVALWDTLNPSPKPTPCGSKDMNVGRLHSVSCYPSSPWLLACGGSGNEIAIWDVEGEDSIQNRFGGRTSGDANVATSNIEEEEPDVDFEAVMAAGDDQATSKALDGMNKSKKKKGKKGKKVHKRK